MPTKAQWANMTEEERQNKKEQQRKWYANRTEEQKQSDKEIKLRWYANRTEKQKKARRESQRKCRANLTEEQKQLQKEYNHKYLANLNEEQKQERREANLKWRANLTEEQKEQEARRAAIAGARTRADRHGLPFDLTLDHINEIWPDDNKCRVFGVPMVRGNNGRKADTSPNLDRIEPAKGYTIGNIEVMCELANRIKTNATPAQVMIVAQYLIKEERERAST